MVQQEGCGCSTHPSCWSCWSGLGTFNHSQKGTRHQWQCHIGCACFGSSRCILVNPSQFPSCVCVCVCGGGGGTFRHMLLKKKKHTTNPSTDDVMAQTLQHGPTEVWRLAVLYITIHCSQQVFNVHTAGQQLLFVCECLLLFLGGGGGGGVFLLLYKEKH